MTFSFTSFLERKKCYATISLFDRLSSRLGVKMLKKRRQSPALLRRKREREKTVITSIRTLPSLRAKLEDLAEKEFLNTNSLINKILTEYIKEAERDDWKGD